MSYALGLTGSFPDADAPPYVRPEVLLADEDAEFVYVAELYPYDLGSTGEEVIGSFPIGSEPLAGAGGVTPFYFATQEWATAPTDAPANQAFDGRLRNPLGFSRSLIGGERFESLVTGDGSLTIDNTDGAYDGLPNDYAIDGRRVVVKVGRTTDAYSDFVTLFEGTARDWHGDVDQIEVLTRDNGYKLEVPAQPNIYGGTGGAEGGDDLAGKRKPILLGPVQHGGPVLVDPALLIYQLADGAIANDVEILDRGVALTPGGNDQASYAALAAYSVAAGEYEFYPAGGYVKLGSLPDGIVSFRGATGGGLAQTGEIIRSLLASTVLLDPQEVAGASFTALDALQPADVGLFVGPDDGSSVADAARHLLAGIGAFGAFDRYGRLYVARIDAPGGDPVDSFDAGDIVALSREPLGSGLSPPPWRIRTAYQRNFMELTGELAGSVSAADRATFAEPYLLAQSADPTIITAHALAQDANPVESYFDAQADAEAEAARLLFLFATGRALWRMQLPRRALLLELGDVITVTFPRFGLAGGMQMTVMETAPAINTGDAADLVEVVAYG